MPKDTRNPADLYKAVMDATQRYVAGVPEDNWTNRTPCDEWDVLDVVNHVVCGNLWLGELFKGKTIEEVGDVFEVDLLRNDPVGAYARSVEIAKAAVGAPGAMEMTTHLSFGDTPGSEYASQMFLDLLIHGLGHRGGQRAGADPRPGAGGSVLPSRREDDRLDPRLRSLRRRPWRNRRVRFAGTTVGTSGPERQLARLGDGRATGTARVSRRHATGTRSWVGSRIGADRCPAVSMWMGGDRPRSSFRGPFAAPSLRRCPCARPR